MKRLILFVFIACGLASAQLPWSGIVAPTRAIDWSGAGVTGGIINRTTNCATLTSTSTAAQIQTAINNCTAGQVVKLGTGTFNLTSGIALKSNVTLRGDGANLTKLNFTSGGTGCVNGGSCALSVSGNSTFTANGDPSPYSTPAANKRAWTGSGGVAGSYPKGATVINLASSTSGVAVGDNLIIYQDDDAAPTAGYMICAATSANAALGCSREGSRGTGQQQIVKVTNIAGSAITISPGIYQDTFVASKNPRVAWWGGTMTGVGIEDLAVIGNAVTRFSNIGFFNAADSWVKGVSSQETGARDHVMIMSSRNVTVRDGFYTLSCVGGCNGAATGYGLETWEATGYLFENNILFNVQSPFLYSAASVGGVTGYNWIPPCVAGCGSGATGLASHEEGFLLNLYEGNDTDYWRADTFHGSQSIDTGFRNKSTGNGEGAVDIWAYNRYWNIIGNVLGQANSNNYQCLSPSASAQCGRFNPNIFRCGFAGANPGPGPEQGNNGLVAQDPFACTSMMIWGNYDTVTGANRFNCSEVPSGLSSFSNPCPLSNTLPASFYLSAMPTWWPSGKPWPPIGPDVTGGNIAGYAGHAYTLPAQDCYNSISGNIANFNALQCYPLGTGTPNVQLSTTLLAFGNQAIGSASILSSFTVTNNGSATLNISSVVLSGANASEFSLVNSCGSTLGVNSSCLIQAQFIPATVGTKSASIVITDNAAGSPHSVSLTGTGVVLAPIVQLSTTTLTFGSQIVGTTSASQIVTLTNGGNASLTLNSITPLGDYTSIHNCPSTLGVGANCSITISFAPANTGARNGTVTIVDNAADSPQVISMSGTGIQGIASFSPASPLVFGTQTLNTTSAAVPVAITNAGTAPLAITAISASGNFAQSNNCPIPPSTLVVNASCSMSVTFTPHLVGANTGSITVTSNGAGTPQTYSLSGTGVSAATCGINVSTTGLTLSGGGMTMSCP